MCCSHCWENTFTGEARKKSLSKTFTLPYTMLPALGWACGFQTPNKQQKINNPETIIINKTRKTRNEVSNMGIAEVHYLHHDDYVTVLWCTHKKMDINQYNNIYTDMTTMLPSWDAHNRMDINQSQEKGEAKPHCPCIVGMEKYNFHHSWLQNGKSWQAYKICSSSKAFQHSTESMILAKKCQYLS